MNVSFFISFFLTKSTDKTEKWKWEWWSGYGVDGLLQIKHPTKYEIISTVRVNFIRIEVSFTKRINVFIYFYIQKTDV